MKTTEYGYNNRSRITITVEFEPGTRNRRLLQVAGKLARLNIHGLTNHEIVRVDLLPPDRKVQAELLLTYEADHALLDLKATEAQANRWIDTKITQGTKGSGPWPGVIGWTVQVEALDR